MNTPSAENISAALTLSYTGSPEEDDVLRSEKVFQTLTPCNIAPDTISSETLLPDLERLQGLIP